MPGGSHCSHPSIYQQQLTFQIFPAHPTFQISFPQLQTINLNRMPADQLEGAKRRLVEGDEEVKNAAAGARSADLSVSANASSSAPQEHVQKQRQQQRGGVPTTSKITSKWRASLPLPKKYELLADVYVALQQVGPLLRKRQQACTVGLYKLKLIAWKNPRFQSLLYKFYSYRYT
jgi:hypothetical protein